MKFILTALLICFSSYSRAEDLHLAVAANFTAPMEKLATAYFEETGYKAIMSYGATGKLYAQIKNGAPFQIFLSADQETPKKLIQEGRGIVGTQFTYSIGKLVLWSTQKKWASSTDEILKKGDYKHLAIANPKLAPYGAAAKEILVKMGIWATVQPRLVIGENIAQTHQFIASGNADLGFVAYSQIKKDGKNPERQYWVVPQAMYSQIKQDAVMLLSGKQSVAAKKFFEFMKSKKAKAIIAEFGYDIH